MSVKPETWNRRLELTGLPKPGDTWGLKGTWPSLARQESVGRVFGHVWNRTNLFLWSEPAPLAGYPDPLLTLILPGQADKVKVICCSGRINPHYTQDGNREMVTVIAWIAADGRVIPPSDIYLGSRHQPGWHAGMQEKEQATFAWSTKGWTNNQPGLERVEQNFEKYTIKMFAPWDWPLVHADYYSAKDKRRILILDGHLSDPIWQFFDLCFKKHIYLICLPAHSTHILQPLDVGLFGPLLCCNCNELDIWVRSGGNAIKNGQFYK